MGPSRTAFILAIGVRALSVDVSDAAASEWGCEVLLCASSSDPSWHGVPACHPPMERLIAAMSSWSFTWPTCPEAGIGAPGFERYADCPAGWTVGYSEVSHGTRSDPNICVKKGAACGRRDSCGDTVSIPRPFREEPYYFDISDNDGSLTRHWFNLRR
ncbi:MAG: hypothetical protein EKK31_01255 [Hyphomicrobiales bacterium]|nr:MAG: hypothetical protein EKK31_01255 [Hyphomicrobiales bacterium]